MAGRRREGAGYPIGGEQRVGFSGLKSLALGDGDRQRTGEVSCAGNTNSYFRLSGKPNFERALGCLVVVALNIEIGTDHHGDGPVVVNRTIDLADAVEYGERLNVDPTE